MNGLLQQPGAGQQTDGQPQAQQQPQSMQQSLSSEQMAQFKQGFQIGQQLLYSEQVFGGLVKDFQDSGDAVSILARLIVRVMEKVQEAVGKLDMVVATSIGLALLGDIADALNQTGRVKIGPEEMTEAFGHGVNLWLNKYGSTYDPQELQAVYQQAAASMPEQQQGGGMPQGGA